MLKPEDLAEGCELKGLAGDDAVRVLKIQRHSGGCVTVYYADHQGHTSSELLYPDAMARLELVQDRTAWTFTADGREFKLASEARRIALAHQFDPYLAVYLSSVEPLPHQIAAVFMDLLPRQPLRFVLADDPGAGKTVMTGLYLKELILRGDVTRCLIVAPGALTEQWRLEMERKFRLTFSLMTPEQLAGAGGQQPGGQLLLIARMDKLARDEALQRSFTGIDWDLIVVDEAHKMSATIFGNEIRYTRRYRLGQALACHTRHFLLLTATPHNGKPEEFELFMALIDPDRFEHLKARERQRLRPQDLSDVLRRMVKEELLTFEGSKLFPGRHASTVSFELSDRERQLYDEVTQYVREQFDRAECLEKSRRSQITFALISLQRRLASSPEAILRSLERRLEKLSGRLAGSAGDGSDADYDDEPDEDDLGDDEDLEGEISASRSAEELQQEIETVTQLAGKARDLVQSGDDRKWLELRELLLDPRFRPDTHGQCEKLIIFTEYKDTLRYLGTRICDLLGQHEALVTIHGSMSQSERLRAEDAFRQDGRVRFLLATDAAGEGLNFQVAHLMVNYDLPWNPNRLEQRFGRVHRIGQQQDCYLWNMVAGETREGAVFERLFAKLETEREALGDKVFDILGRLDLEGRSLRDLILGAIRYNSGNAEHEQGRIGEAVDQFLDHDALKRLLEEQSLDTASLDLRRIMEIRADMVRLEARKLQPHYLSGFFREAFTALKGSISEREPHRYAITSVPLRLRSESTVSADQGGVLSNYKRVCFDRELCDVQDGPQADLLCPGHPLMDALVREVTRSYGGTLSEGSVLVDGDAGEERIRVLFYIDFSLADAGGHEVLRKLVFVEMAGDGSAQDAGFAPYLDYRPLRAEEREAASDLIGAQAWLNEGMEERAHDYAISTVIPEHTREFTEEWENRLDRQKCAIDERLSRASHYWHQRANELRDQERSGTARSGISSGNARRRAEELELRRDRRLERIARDRRLRRKPPLIAGAAVIIPEMVLKNLRGEEVKPAADAQARRQVERAAMQAVLKIERELGFKPQDVSASRGVGYDIESEVPPELMARYGALRIIEVKGRRKGETSVTLTHNEILASWNRPEEFILALVEVDGVHTYTRYLKRPFRHEPTASEEAITFNIRQLIKDGELLCEKAISL